MTISIPQPLTPAITQFSEHLSTLETQVHAHLAPSPDFDESPTGVVARLDRLESDLADLKARADHIITAKEQAAIDLHALLEENEQLLLTVSAGVEIDSDDDDETAGSLERFDRIARDVVDS